jgi:excisionase family DNA binding protein
MSQPGNDRLDSWKEIAEHLKRDLRTVRRWETERGLPVHRVPGSGRRVVFAYRSEIDAWLHRAKFESNPALASLSNNLTAISPPNENKRSPRHSLGLLPRLTVVGIVLVAASLLVFALRVRKDIERVRGDSMAKPLVEPSIASVTPILPRPDQMIVIKGRDFGWYTAFNGLDSPFLAIRDITGKWAAGRIIDRNPDYVTLNVEEWSDSEIIITGLSGKYGQGIWKLQPGDSIDVAVWNPQTGAGPAIFHVVCGDSGR